MENQVEKIWIPEQRGQPFIFCWPHHHEFWLPELSPGGPKEHAWQVWAAAFLSSCFFFVTVHCDMLHARHQLITSAWSLYSNHWLRYFFNLGHGGTPDLHNGRSHLKESCEVGTHFKGQLHTILTNVPFPPQCSPVQDGLNTIHQPYRLSLHYIISSPQKLLIWDVFQLVTLTGKVPDPMLCILGIPCLINKYLHFRELSIYFGNFTSPCWKNRDELG